MKKDRARLPRSLAPLALSLGLLWTAVATSPGQALYSQTFDNTTALTVAASQINWSAYTGSSATNISTAANVNGTDYVAVANAAGNPGTPNGFIFANNGATANQTFGILAAFSTGITVANGTQISWTMGNNLATATAQLLIQVGGNGTAGSGTWYASTQAFSNSTAYSTASFQSAAASAVTFSLAFSDTASAWKAFTLTPGTAMSLGATLGSNLPSNTITGIGFYLADGSTLGSSIRLDSLTVAPEPPAAALLLLGALALGGASCAAQKLRLSRIR